MCAYRFASRSFSSSSFWRRHTSCSTARSASDRWDTSGIVISSMFCVHLPPVFTPRTTPPSLPLPVDSVADAVGTVWQTIVQRNWRGCVLIVDQFGQSVWGGGVYRRLGFDVVRVGVMCCCQVSVAGAQVFARKFMQKCSYCVCVPIMMSGRFVILMCSSLCSI